MARKLKYRDKNPIVHCSYKITLRLGVEWCLNLFRERKEMCSLKAFFSKLHTYSHTHTHTHPSYLAIFMSLFYSRYILFHNNIMPSTKIGTRLLFLPLSLFEASTIPWNPPQKPLSHFSFPNLWTSALKPLFLSIPKRSLFSFLFFKRGERERDGQKGKDRSHWWPQQTGGFP